MNYPELEEQKVDDFGMSDRSNSYKIGIIAGSRVAPKK